MILPKFMLVAETPMRPIEAGCSSLSILWMGRARRPRWRGAEFTTRATSHHALADLHGIQLQRPQHHACVRIARRVGVRQREQPVETRLERSVGERMAVALGNRNELLIGDRAPEQAEKILAVGQLDGGVDGGAIPSEIAFRQGGIQPTGSRADDHAEFARGVEADAQGCFGRRCARCRSRIEREAEDCEQRLDLRSGKDLAPVARDTLQQRRHWRDVQGAGPAGLRRIVHGGLPAPAGIVVRSTINDAPERVARSGRAK